MAPPQLPRDAPVADVVHPLVVNLGPVVGDENNFAGIDNADGRFRERLDPDEPLGGDERLDDILGAFAPAEAHGVIFDLLDQTELFEIRHDPLARFEPVETGIAAGLLGHSGVFANDFDLGQIVALAGLKVVGIVRGRDFHDAGAEFGIGQVVENDGNFAIHQRQHHGLAVQSEVARVFRIHRDGGVAQHGLRPRGRHDEITVRAHHRIANMPQMSGGLLMLDLEIGEHRLAGGAPVDHVFAAVNQPFFPEPDENFAHGARKSRIHGEALAGPIAARAHADHLAFDGVAVLFFPLPDALNEFFAADFAAARAFLRELPDHHHFGRDAGVIRTRQP